MRSACAGMGCLWDRDTIKMERLQFPSTLELISGKFLRHSKEFYEWRVADRLKQLQADPANVSLLDDLAVAYDKIGNHQQAIETAIKTEEILPGRYETSANLGTFYIHAGKLEEGISSIDRALKINPDAHFGRELYQRQLVEYVLERRRGGSSRLPLAMVRQPAMDKKQIPSYQIQVMHTFDEFLGLPRDKLNEPADQEQVQAAIKGLLGMMRFGNYDFPVLLEALGSLLPNTEDERGAKLLAARAFLKASYEVDDESSQKAYRGLAARSLLTQTHPGTSDQITLEEVELKFRKELAEAREWYDQLRKREISWILQGKNPEIEFDRLYDLEPAVSGMDVIDPLPEGERIRYSLLILCLIFIVAVCSVAVFVIRRIGRHLSSNGSS